MQRLNSIHLRNPKPNTRFQNLDGRLALFNLSESHVGYWKQYWNDQKRLSLTSKGSDGDLGEFGELVEKYVPKDRPILEAGCGPAHLVLALKKRGYAAIGVDYEPDVIRFVNQNFPDLDVRQGDILALDIESASIGCYFSIGVVEHFIDGPNPALIEARRVVDSTGVMLISVPYLNPLRRTHQARITSSDDADLSYQFYQHYFSIEKFAAELSKAGFKVVDQLPYAVESFLIREHPFFSAFWHSKICRIRVKRIFRKWFKHAPSRMRNRYGHMILFVCQPV